MNGPGTKYFRINPKSGLVTTRTYKSREVRTTNDVTIIAEDQGKPQLRKEVKATLHFTNGNPLSKGVKSPVFVKARENLRIGSLLTDEIGSQFTDSVEKANFEIVDGDPESKFQIDFKTGKLLSQINFEYNKISLKK